VSEHYHSWCRQCGLGVTFLAGAWRHDAPGVHNHLAQPHDAPTSDMSMRAQVEEAIQDRDSISALLLKANEDMLVLEAEREAQERQIAGLRLALATLSEHTPATLRELIREMALAIEGVLDGAALDDGIVHVAALHRLSELYDARIKPLGPSRMPAAPDAQGAALAVRAVQLWDGAKTDEEFAAAYAALHEAADAVCPRDGASGVSGASGASLS
jgi:hypothetical protein